MTWHFFRGEHIECSECGTSFLPFEADQPCPKCESPASTSYEFVDDAVNAMRIHKSDYGSYTPPAYYVGSGAESVFYYASRMMDKLEETSQTLTEREIGEVLSKVDWGENPHMEAYFARLLTRIVDRQSVLDESDQSPD